MTPDPYFTEVGKSSSVPIRRRWWIKLVLAPLLLFSGCHTLLTGFPFPLWHIERLNNPVVVSAIGSESLVLADGRQVRLPFIKKLPKDDPAFARAVSRGVEVGEDGKVFGLIEPRRMCGNDPVVFYRFRIDLSELAGSLDPDGIDDSIVHPGLIQHFKELHGRDRDSKGLPYFVGSQMRQLRDFFESARSRREPERSSSAPIASAAPDEPGPC